MWSISLKFILVAFVLTVSGITISSDEKQEQPNDSYEVDALGDDFIDFGAITGPKGSFSWHSDHPAHP